MNPLKTSEAGPSREKPFKCVDCRKGFNSKWYMDKHIREEHLVTDSFPCNQCDKSYKRKHHLKRHVMFSHSTEGESPKSECPQCGKMVQCLALHIKTVHKKEELTHECQVCRKKYPSAGHLAIHFRVHTRDKPFECDQCPQAFGRVDVLKTHVSTVHRQEKPFKCNVCSKYFGQTAHLLKHAKIHTRSRKRANKKRTSAASNSSATDRSVFEPEFENNTAIIQDEVIQEDLDYEEFPAYSIDVSAVAEEFADFKMEEVFDWQDKENGDDDRISY